MTIKGVKIMSKYFIKFLSLLGIDYNKYKDYVITNKNGEQYKLSQINEQRLKEFDWAYMLTQNNELVVFDYREELKEIIDKIYRNKCSCYFGNILERKADLILTKDITKFLGFMVSMDRYSQMLYIDNNDNDIYILKSIRTKKMDAVEKLKKKLSKLALKLGIVFFECYKFAFVGNDEDKQIYDIIKAKNKIFEQRNEKEIKTINDKLKIQIEKVVNIKIDEEDEIKMLALAQKAYNKIAEFGLGDLCDKKQGRKEKLINVFKIVLYKKWITFNKLVEPDYIECDLFHWFEDLQEDEEEPTEAELIFYIKDRKNY
jgi:hypothetical protein